MATLRERCQDFFRRALQNAMMHMGSPVDDLVEFVKSERGRSDDNNGRSSMSIGSVLSSLGNINQLWSVIGVGQAIRPLISQALSGASLDTMARSILSSGVIDTLEKAAESLFPNVANELRLAAGIVAAYDHDKTKWLQQALNAILNAGLEVDGIYGPATVAAVEQFQQKTVGLKVDGWAYRVTTPLIEAALAKILVKAPSVATEQVAVTTPAQVAT